MSQKQTIKLSLLSQARLDFKLGLNVIPLKRGEKRPALASWREYLDRFASWEERQQWFGENKGFGCAVLCGKVSSGLVIFDFEKIDDFQKFFEKWEELKENTRVVRTPHGGVHVYFRSRIPARRSIRICEDHPLDLLGEGGYAVGAPTEINHDLCDKSKCALSGFDSYEVQGTYQIAELFDDPYDRLRSRCLNLGWKVKSASGMWEKLSGVEQGERNMTAFELSRHLLFTAKLPKNIAFQILLAWNDRNRPPLDELELKRTFESARRYPKQESRETERIDGV
jgi:hypothetical protein